MPQVTTAEKREAKQDRQCHSWQGECRRALGKGGKEGENKVGLSHKGVGQGAEK